MESSSSPTDSYIDEKPMITGEFFCYCSFNDATSCSLQFRFRNFNGRLVASSVSSSFAMISASILNEIRTECDKAKVFSMAAERNEIESIV